MFILLVENNQFHASVLCKMLLKAGFNTIGFVDSGLDCIKLMHQNKTPDVVIIDENECTVKGVDILKSIQQTNANTRIIILTSDESTISEAHYAQGNSISYFKRDNLASENFTRTLYDIFTEKIRQSNKPVPEPIFSGFGKSFSFTFVS